MTHTQEVLQKIDEACRTAKAILKQPESTARYGVLASLRYEVEKHDITYMVMFSARFPFESENWIFRHREHSDCADAWNRVHERCQALLAVLEQAPQDTPCSASG